MRGHTELCEEMHPMGRVDFSFITCDLPVGHQGRHRNTRFEISWCPEKPWLALAQVLARIEEVLQRIEAQSRTTVLQGGKEDSRG